MKHVHIYKAQPILGIVEVEPVTIAIDQNFPDLEEFQDIADVANTDAIKLENVLWGTLPGEVYGQLLIKMFQRKISQFISSSEGMQ